jgi:hypothetical protein
MVSELFAASSSTEPVPAFAIKQPISLFIAYIPGYFTADGNMPCASDSKGVIPMMLLQMISQKVSAILINDVIELPMINAAFADYLLRNSASDERTVRILQSACKREDWAFWEHFCDDAENIGIKLLREYTPYFVNIPMRRGSTTTTLSDERFVLFIRKDANFVPAKAFNMRMLEEVDLFNEKDSVEKNMRRAEFFGKRIIKARPVKADRLAESIQSIFNTTQQLYTWNILIAGHGWQMGQLDAPLITRFSQKTLSTLGAAALTKEAADIDPHLAALNEQLEQGAIATMPPQQFGKLLNFFSTLPVNIVWIISCFSGGYNLSLIEQQLRLLEKFVTQKQSQEELNAQLSNVSEQRRLILDQIRTIQKKLDAVQKGELKLSLQTENALREKIKKLEEQDQKMVDSFPLITKALTKKSSRNFIVATSTAFDLESVTQPPVLTFNFLHLETVFSKSLNVEVLKKVIANSFFGSPAILLPTGSRFELTKGPTKEEFADLAKKQIIYEKEVFVSPRSFEMLAAHDPKNITRLFQEAFIAHNTPLMENMLATYPEQLKTTKIAEYLTSKKDEWAIQLAKEDPRIAAALFEDAIKEQNFVLMKNLFFVLIKDFRLDQKKTGSIVAAYRKSQQETSTAVWAKSAFKKLVEDLLDDILKSPIDKLIDQIGLVLTQLSVQIALANELGISDDLLKRTQEKLALKDLEDEFWEEFDSIMTKLAQPFDAKKMQKKIDEHQKDYEDTYNRSVTSFYPTSERIKNKHERFLKNIEDLKRVVSSEPVEISVAERAAIDALIAKELPKLRAIRTVPVAKERQEQAVKAMMQASSEIAGILSSVKDGSKEELAKKIPSWVAYQITYNNILDEI